MPEKLEKKTSKMRPPSQFRTASTVRKKRVTNDLSYVPKIRRYEDTKIR